MTEFVRTSVNLTPAFHKKVIAYGKAHGMNCFGETVRDIIRRYLEGKCLSQATRRSRNSVESLPAELGVVVRHMLLENKWPVDFGQHYNGTPRYVDIVRYCKEKGYTVSKSAVGRFAVKIRGPMR